MIRTIHMNGFKGQMDTTINLEPLTVVTGANGSGKSTIPQALEFALLGYARGLDLDKTPQAMFDALAGVDRSELHLELETDDGHSVKRTLRKNKSGKVRSANIEVDGQKVGARQNVGDMICHEIFNVREFWRKSPDQKIAMLCPFAGIEPDRLSSLDEKIEEAKHQHQVLAGQSKTAKAALVELRKEVDNASTDGTIDLAGREARMRELASESRRLTEEIRSMEDARGKRDARQFRIAEIMEEIVELNARTSGFQPPEGEVASPREIDTLQAQIFEYAKDLDLRADRARIETEIEQAQPGVEPVDPTESRRRVREIREILARMTVLGTKATEVDHVVMGVMKRIWGRIRPLICEMADFEQIRAAFTEETADHQTRIVGEQTDAAHQAEIKSLKSEEKELVQFIDAYDSEIARYRAAISRVSLLRETLKRMPEPDDCSHEIEIARQRLAQMQLDAGHLAQAKADHERDVKKIDSLRAEMEHLSSVEKQDAGDPHALIEQRAEMDREKAELEDLIREDERYRTIMDTAERKERESRDLAARVRSARDEEESLLREKADLLTEIQGKLQERCNAITHPGTIAIDIQSGKNGYVKFWLNKPGGSRTLREVASGAEGVEIDIAISSALMCEHGIVVAECAELQSDRIDGLIQRLQQAHAGSQTQIILVRYGLEKYDGVDGIHVVKMGDAA